MNVIDKTDSSFQLGAVFAVRKHRPDIQIQKKPSRIHTLHQIQCFLCCIDKVRVIHRRIGFHSNHRSMLPCILSQLPEERDHKIHTGSSIFFAHFRHVPISWASEDKIMTAHCLRKINCLPGVIKKHRSLFFCSEYTLRPSKPDRLHGRYRKAILFLQLLRPFCGFLQMFVWSLRENPGWCDLKTGKAKVLHPSIYGLVLFARPGNI